MFALLINCCSKFMRTECLNSRLVFKRAMPVARLASMAADSAFSFFVPASLLNASFINLMALEAQVNTQRYGRRPYGVGLLVAGYDVCLLPGCNERNDANVAQETGAHLYEFCPSGNYYDYIAMGIGARSQSAKTYFEKHFASFENGIS